MVEVTPVIDAIVKYGLAAVLVLVTVIFLRAEVIPKSTHREIVRLWKDRMVDSDNRCRELMIENDRLWQVALTTGKQASRATMLAERTLVPRRVANLAPTAGAADDGE